MEWECNLDDQLFYTFTMYPCRPFVEVLKLDLLLDDGFRQITSITTRRHMSTSELGKLVGGNPMGKVLDAPSPMHLIEKREGVSAVMPCSFSHALIFLI